MRKVQWVLLFILSATIARAEWAKDAVNAFRDSLGNGQFILRNFSGEDQVRAVWKDTALQLDEPRWRTLGVLTIESVKLNGTTLNLSCKRHIVIKDKNDKTVLYADTQPVEVQIDLRGGDPTEVLPKLKDALFFPSIDNALGAIPDSMRRAVPARIDNKPAAFESKPKPHCDCADKAKPDCEAVPLSSDGMTVPRYVSGDPPKFSNEAERTKMSGSVDVALTVDENGRPTNVWVTRPLGKGLDEAAAISVLSYVFRPATCHGKPVPVFLFVDVPFKVF